MTADFYLTFSRKVMERKIKLDSSPQKKNFEGG